MSSAEKTVIVIAGPTAVGKTAVGMAVAKHFGAEIISADSRQCFRELSVGVARPAAEDLSAVPHHFIASHSIFEKITAAFFEEYALARVEQLFKKNDVAVMVGGTGLYVKAFTDGMDEIPEVPEAIHSSVREGYNKNGLAWLQEQLKVADPLFYENGERQNPQRGMRALEVIKATGRSVLSFRTGKKKRRDFATVKIALDLPREDLYHRINHRVDLMMEEGLLQEVESLVPNQNLNALQTVGYKELFAYFRGEATLGNAVDRIKQNTRHYAKRQLTWFRKEDDFHWMPPDAATVIHFVEKALSQKSPEA